jgi:DsbC/DsbD-like thiol-disulfide interchange protein
MCRLIVFGVSVFAFVAQVSAAARANVDHATVELVAEKTSFAPGEQAWVGVVIAHEPNWHTYWINPGDSGLPTKLQWRLPKEFHAGEIAWPAPKRFDIGSLYNFGYDETVLLPVPIDVPASARDGSSVMLAVDAKWLICSHEICLPGKTSLELAVPIAKDAKTNTRSESLFARAREELPKPAPWRGVARLTGNRIDIELSGADLPSSAGLEIFSVVSNVIDNTPPKLRTEGSRLVIDAAKSDYLEKAPSALQLVLTERTGDQVGAWQIEIPLRTPSKSH